MADLKISALTSATTPVAGTEVLPIVQSGTTKKVSIDNLTAGKTVPAQQVNVTSTNTAEVHLICTGQQEYIIGSTGSSYGDAGKLITYLIGVGELSQYDTAGNLKLQKGNIIQGTAAKGVNFTANTPAAGMTSQLLNWYEEGTWTPSDGSGAGLTFTITGTSTYTRVGRLVTVMADITFPATANTNLVLINGLPFTSAAAPNGAGSIGYTDYGAWITAAPTSSGTGFRFVVAAGFATNANLSGKRVQVCLTYIV